MKELFNIRSDFGKREKDTCVNSTGMNAMFGIPHKFRLRVIFSNHISTRENKQGSPVPTTSGQIALTAAQNKFCFHFLGNKMITLVLAIKY